MFKVGILGCGAIYNRHLDAIKKNKNFKLMAVCDINKDLSENYGKIEKVRSYTKYKEMIKSSNINFVAVCTPNDLHFEQAKFALENKINVLIEKPVAFSHKKILELEKIALENQVNCYCVLQVRLNNAVKVVKEAIDKKLLGEIRSISLVQRWQRPYEYFSGWRNIPKIGGGILYEVGIHYIDIMQYIFGVPNIISSSYYKTKHKNANIEDTVYALLDYKTFGGTLESTVSAEPHNLECSLQILGSNGYLKLGGKAMNVIESYNFLAKGSERDFKRILEDYPNENKNPNNYGSYLGSCPNHEFVYKNLDKFSVGESINSIKIIEEIYKKSDISYS